MDSKDNKRIFWAALRYYKLTGRSRLNLLVPYTQFSFDETKNTWPILWTTVLLFFFNLAIVIAYAWMLAHGTSPKAPSFSTLNETDYETLMGWAIALFFVVYSSYKFARAIRVLWRLAQNHAFDAGFPSEIDVRKVQ